VQVFTKAPNAVVFLDEFEKGHCEGIPPLLLKMLDKDGRLTGMLHSA
jgi:ATP-dependent Clp protease ATP-binding subunit ClpA